jgi:hypothetical protein
MTLPDLVPLFAQTGVFGVLSYVMYLLHRDAVRTHERRAEDWRASAAEWKAIAMERDRQLAHILGAVKETAGS